MRCRLSIRSLPWASWPCGRSPRSHRSKWRGEEYRAGQGGGRCSQAGPDRSLVVPTRGSVPLTSRQPDRRRPRSGRYASADPLGSGEVRGQQAGVWPQNERGKQRSKLAVRTLKPGDEITVTLIPAKSGAPVGFSGWALGGGKVVLANGKTITTEEKPEFFQGTDTRGAREEK